MKRKSIFVCLSLFACTVFCASTLKGDSVNPPSIEATLNPGECITENKTVTLTGSPQSVDIVFSFDLTGSMGGIIDTAKAKAIEIMAAIQAELPGSAIRFGAASYMDYPQRYSSCGYSATYGSASDGDYAYRLDSPLTSNTSVVATAINDMVLGSGSDGPQDYSRVLYESYSDTNIVWGDGVRIWINFGDNVPHDCNLNEGVPGKVGTFSTGGDPGRDEIMGTADDIDLQAALAEMAANNIILMELHTTTSRIEYWTYWTGITGGSVFLTASAGSDLIDQIVAAVGEAARNISVLTLKASDGCPLDVTVDPPEYTDIVVPEDGINLDFTVTICVPETGVECGLQECAINAVGDGAVLAKQQVSIDVPCETAIELKSFKARTGSNGKVILTWETVTEVDNTGFNLYRAESSDGNYVKINNTLIEAKGSAVSGARYKFVDKPGKGTFYYKLEDIDYNGQSTLHGPVDNGKNVKLSNQKGKASIVTPASLK